VAASAAWSTSSWLSGWMIPQVRSPTRMPWTGLRKIVFRLLQKVNSDRSATAAVLVNRAFRAAELHPVEEQLVPVQAAALLQDRHRAPRQASREPGLVAGLLPAQPAVAVLDRQGPPAAGAPGLAGMLVPPDRA